MKKYKGLYIPPLVEKERVTCGELSSDNIRIIGCLDLHFCEFCIASAKNIEVLNEWVGPNPQTPHHEQTAIATSKNER